MRGPDSLGRITRYSYKCVESDAKVAGYLSDFATTQDLAFCLRMDNEHGLRVGGCRAAAAGTFYRVERAATRAVLSLIPASTLKLV
jgi:hypothetical protein